MEAADSTMPGPSSQGRLGVEGGWKQRAWAGRRDGAGAMASSEHLRERHGSVDLQLQCGDLVAQRDLERVACLLGLEEARVLLVAKQLRLVQRGLPGGGQASDRRLAGA